MGIASPFPTGGGAGGGSSSPGPRGSPGASHGRVYSNQALNVGVENIDAPSAAGYNTLSGVLLELGDQWSQTYEPPTAQFETWASDFSVSPAGAIVFSAIFKLRGDAGAGGGAALTAAQIRDRLEGLSGDARLGAEDIDLDLSSSDYTTWSPDVSLARLRGIVDSDGDLSEVRTLAHALAIITSAADIASIASIANANAIAALQTNLPSLVGARSEVFSRLFITPHNADDIGELDGLDLTVYTKLSRSAVATYAGKQLWAAVGGSSQKIGDLAAAVNRGGGDYGTLQTHHFRLTETQAASIAQNTAADADSIRLEIEIRDDDGSTVLADNEFVAVTVGQTQEILRDLVVDAGDLPTGDSETVTRDIAAAVDTLLGETGGAVRRQWVVTGLALETRVALGSIPAGARITLPVATNAASRAGIAVQGARLDISFAINYAVTLSAAGATFSLTRPAAATGTPTAGNADSCRVLAVLHRTD